MTRRAPPRICWRNSPPPTTRRGATAPARRYGPGTAAILRAVHANRAQWRELATAMFPWGSYGNGSAMRVAPVGLAYHDDLTRVAEVAIASSRPTHSHPLAYQGAVLQATAVAVAVRSTAFAIEDFLRPMRAALADFDDRLQNISAFAGALNAIERGVCDGTPCAEMSDTLGTGTTAVESVPMALYCFLRQPASYERVIHEAVFVGGDNHTIACMAGAIAGASLGAAAVPERWRAAVHEDEYPIAAVEALADRLLPAGRA